MKRNPNGYGSVIKLSGERRRPYLVRSGVYGYDERGNPRYHIIGYAATPEEGRILLAQYNSDPWDVDRAKMTLQELFDLWKEKKAPRLGQSNRKCLCYAFKHLYRYANRPYKQLKPFQMQETIDECGKGYATQHSIKNLWSHLDRFARELDVTTRSYADLLTADAAPPTSRDRLSDEQIRRLWDHKDEPWVDTALILIYSGWRIAELLSMPLTDVDLSEGTMKGGSKTNAGKNRIVPIHSLIRPFIEARASEGGQYLITHKGARMSPHTYRNYWLMMRDRYDLPGTPHWCRHTFESLLDSAGANRKCIDIMMGHVSKDTGNRVYNHKTISELKTNIELITLR